MQIKWTCTENNEETLALNASKMHSLTRHVFSTYWEINSPCSYFVSFCECHRL